MTDLSVFDIAHRHAEWLAARQVAVAGNIAHFSTPGYRAVDVRPFAAYVEATGLLLDTTNESRLRETASTRGLLRSVKKPATTTHSGNTVSLDEQLMIANEIRQGYALNAGILKSFHRMMMTAVKG